VTEAAQRRQTAIGLGLALLIGGCWLALHIYGVFFHDLTPWGWAVAPLLVASLCWLNVGLFIVAHDCMHGSLAPGRPALNRAVGRVALLLYAGFWMDRLMAKHRLHHVHAGTGEDPDFAERHPTRFWPWYLAFFREYIGWREFGILALLLWSYILLLGASPVNALLFWGVPAILSSLQLFYFGTFLPHRQDEQDFTDRHRARSNDFSLPVSLLTCFHFGYHHEHHRAPHLPWWRLPEERRAGSSRTAPLQPDRQPG
jgi:beta-carotene ketolase (CrtW type)